MHARYFRVFWVSSIQIDCYIYATCPNLTHSHPTLTPLPTPSRPNLFKHWRNRRAWGRVNTPPPTMFWWIPGKESKKNKYLKKKKKKLKMRRKEAEVNKSWFGWACNSLCRTEICSSPLLNFHLKSIHQIARFCFKNTNFFSFWGGTPPSVTTCARNDYRLITAYLLLRVNLDKIMHARWDFDASSARTRRVSALDKHQNWSASALFCLNSRAQSKYAVVNLIHTRRKQIFLSFIMW